MNPNINVPSVWVGLVCGDPAPVWRKTHVVIGRRQPDRARWLSAAVKPRQLRKGRAFSRLRAQNLPTGDTENRPRQRREGQDFVAKDVRLPGQDVAPPVEWLCNQRIIPQVQQVAWLRIGRVRARAYERASFLRIQGAQEDRVIF